MLACKKNAKKWVIISDQIARTECEMANFVLKKMLNKKGPSVVWYTNLSLGMANKWKLKLYLKKSVAEGAW